MSVCYKMKEKESYIEKQKDIFRDTTWFTYRYEVNGMVYETSAGSLDICRKARDKWMKMMSVAFTGHRTIRTNKYALSVSLNEEVRFCYENGIRFFYIGCAVGFDMMAAHTVIEQRKHIPIWFWWRLFLMSGKMCISTKRTNRGTLIFCAKPTRW